jgi:hypothetical protein
MSCPCHRNFERSMMNFAGDRRDRRSQVLGRRQRDQGLQSPRHGRHRRLGVQDRNGAVPLSRASRRSFPLVELTFAENARDATFITIEVAKRSPSKSASRSCPGDGQSRPPGLDVPKPTLGRLSCSILTRHRKAALAKIRKKRN